MKNWPPKSFVLFSIAVVFVGLLPAVELPCPISYGTGIIKAARGFKVESVETKQIGVEDDFMFSECGIPTKIPKYIYEVDASLKNETTELIRGSVLVKFQISNIPVFFDGTPIEVAPPRKVVLVEIPAGTTKNITVVAKSSDIPYGVTIEETTDIPCPVDRGTGKLPFVEWLTVSLHNEDLLTQ